MKVGVASILTKSRSKAKLVLAGLGMLLSIVIISSVFQLYNDFSFLLTENESEDGYDYIQISKEVGISTSLGLSSSKFSKKEVQKIKDQPFIQDVGALHSNDFRVYGRFAGNGFDMFFTSVEEEFIDADLKDFKWEQGETVIPVIISNQFLTILNHAVLPNQGQPPIPKIAIKQAVVNLTLSKEGKRIVQKARVVGFSDRISSVLVPKNFLDYANKELSGKTDSRVSMVLLKVKDARSAQLRNYLDRNDYEVAGEMPMLDNAKTVLGITITVLSIFGFVIMLLSFSLNISQFELLITQNKDRIQMLVLLGYSPKYIVQSVMKIALKIIGGIVVLASVLIYAEFTYLHEVFIDLKLGSRDLSPFLFCIPLLIATTFLLFLSRSIKKQIN